MDELNIIGKLFKYNDMYYIGEYKEYTFTKIHSQHISLSPTCTLSSVKHEKSQMNIIVNGENVIVDYYEL